MGQFNGVPKVSDYKDACKQLGSVHTEDIVVSMQRVFHKNYGHCLIQLLPTLCLLDEAGIPNNIPIVIPSTLASQPFFKEISQRGAMRNRRWIVQDGSFIRAKELIFAKVEWTSAPILNKLLDDIDAPHGAPDASRRLFILRDNRLISNFQEIRPELERHGFELIRPEEYTVAEQMQLFSDASIVCGTTGSALTNCMFSRGNRLKIIEIRASDWHDMFFTRMANLFDFDHMSFVGSKFTGTRESEFSVDPNEFAAFLADAVESTPSVAPSQ